MKPADRPWCTLIVEVEVLDPKALLTVNMAVKYPALVYVWEGFCAVLLADPSPKFHCQLVGELPDMSVNWTFNGDAPLMGVAVKLAVGAELEPEDVKIMVLLTIGPK
jgi:hypothetical protein